MRPKKLSRKLPGVQSGRGKEEVRFGGGGAPQSNEEVCTRSKEGEGAKFKESVRQWDLTIIPGPGSAGMKGVRCVYRV